MPGGRLHTFSDSSGGGNTGVGIQLLIATGTSSNQTRLFEVTGTSITLGLPLHFPDGTIQYTAGGGGGGEWTANGNDIYNNNYSIGNVGIGTQTPAQKLDVLGSSVAFYNTAGSGYGTSTLLLQADDGMSGRQDFASVMSVGMQDYGGGVSIPNTKGGLIFRTSNGSLYDRMMIDYVGNVGIATNQPAALLHTFTNSGNTGVGVQLLVSTGTPGNRTDLLEVTGSSITLGAPIRVAIPSAFVGVGTNLPSSRFDVLNGSITIRGTNMGLSVGSSNLVVASGGNIGVGTSVGTSKFDVLNGSITIRGTGMGLTVGATNFVVNSAGNTGIGTNGTLARLHVYTGSGDNGPMFAVSSGTTKLFEVTGTSITIGVPMNGPAISYPKRATMWHDESTVLTGNALFVYTHASQFAGGAYQTPSADGDSFTNSFFISSGTYNFKVLTSDYSDRGKIDWYIDGVSIATGQDHYTATAQYNQIHTVSNVTISKSGYHVLKGIVNGKNVSSTSYFIAITKMWFVPASD
jgi:hypothetical protein